MLPRLAFAQEHTQPPRQRAHPLPHRHLGDHLLGEVHRGVGHAAAEARGAEAATLAAEPEWTESTKWTESREVYGVPLARSEGDKPLQAAPLAAVAHAAVLEQAATQVWT
jgi:hypothetical protein